jgi:hypothetical protein
MRYAAAYTALLDRTCFLITALSKLYRTLHRGLAALQMSGELQ